MFYIHSVSGVLATELLEFVEYVTENTVTLEL